MMLLVDLNKKENGLASFEFVNPIEKIIKKANLKYEIIHYKKLDSKLLKKCSKIILCGTTLIDNDFLKNIDLFQWIKDFEKPIFGICAGMQIIGSVFDCKVISNKEIGLIKIKTIEKNILFDGEFDAYSLHQNAILPSKDFSILAKSDDCIHALQHVSKPFYGVLFHPEVRNEQIMLNFLEKA